jgi:hypothetical protein
VRIWRILPVPDFLESLAAWAVNYLESLPLWALKALAAVLGLSLVALAGLFFRRMFKKLEDNLPLK